jgi:signal transduction histidine kinase
MRQFSLRRRLIVLVLLLECLLAGAMSGATLFFTWHEQIHAFDLMLRGRADSLLGQVHDAEDVNDDVTIDPRALDLHPGDLWMVRDTGQRVVAHSRNWSGSAAAGFGADHKPHTFRFHHRLYRGLELHGVRQIDADDTSPGIARPVTIRYAVALHPVFHEMHRAFRFLLLASILLLLVTGALLAWLLRRGLAPLGSLSMAASRLSPKHPLFRAPNRAKQTAELAPLAAALESATQRLEEAFRQQQVFVHDAAHELKTAVTIVKSSLQLLASRPRSAAEYASGLDTCMADCARMEELVQRMLQLARFERGTVDKNARCDLMEIAQDVAAQIERLAKIRGVHFAVNTPDTVSVPLAEDACASLLANLMLNAVQHTPSGGAVRVRVSVSESVTIEIRDNGHGIPPEDLPHLFERFWRGDASRARSTGGAGLGLAICKAIVDSCGGEIAIASHPGEGTCVTVQLPLSRSDTAPQPRIDEPAIH